MSKKVFITQEQLDAHLNTYGYANHTQIDSAIYHTMKEHEEKFHKRRFKLNKVIAARIILFVLWALGCSSYFLWPSADTRSISILCATMFIVLVFTLLCVTAMGDSK